MPSARRVASHNLVRRTVAPVDCPMINRVGAWIRRRQMKFVTCALIRSRSPADRQHWRDVIDRYSNGVASIVRAVFIGGGRADGTCGGTVDKYMRRTRRI